MSTKDTPRETAVFEGGRVVIPVEIRRQLDIDPGDVLRWSIDEDDSLTVEVVHQREGVFDDFEPVGGGETDAVEVEDEFGAE